jgi:hypothetical protein
VTACRHDEAHCKCLAAYVPSKRGEACGSNTVAKVQRSGNRDTSSVKPTERQRPDAPRMMQAVTATVLVPCELRRPIEADALLARALMPISVRALIKVRSNLDRSPKMVSINWPWGVVVSARLDGLKELHARHPPHPRRRVIIGLSRPFPGELVKMWKRTRARLLIGPGVASSCFEGEVALREGDKDG